MLSGRHGQHLLLVSSEDGCTSSTPTLLSGLRLMMPLMPFLSILEVDRGAALPLDFSLNHPPLLMPLVIMDITAGSTCGGRVRVMEDYWRLKFVVYFGLLLGLTVVDYCC